MVVPAKYKDNREYDPKLDDEREWFFIDANKMIWSWTGKLRSLFDFVQEGALVSTNEGALVPISYVVSWMPGEVLDTIMNVQEEEDAGS